VCFLPTRSASSQATAHRDEATVLADVGLNGKDTQACLSDAQSALSRAPRPTLSLALWAGISKCDIGTAPSKRPLSQVSRAGSRVKNRCLAQSGSFAAQIAASGPEAAWNLRVRKWLRVRQPGRDRTLRLSWRRGRPPHQCRAELGFVFTKRVTVSCRLCWRHAHSRSFRGILGARFRASSHLVAATVDVVDSGFASSRQAECVFGQPWATWPPNERRQPWPQRCTQ
jgi:hypothetical protein